MSATLSDLYPLYRNVVENAVVALAARFPIPQIASVFPLPQLRSQSITQAAMSSSDAQPPTPTKRIAMTLNIKSDQIDEYMHHHAHSRPEVRHALHTVGIRNLSLWNWGNRLFYYAEYVGDEPFDQAMERYSKMDGVKDWEQLMHKYQDKLPGSDGDVWWQPCQLVYYQA